MASGPITSWQIDGETMETVTNFLFLVSKITGDGDYSHEIKRHLQRHYFANKDLSSSTYSFSSSHVWMWELDHEESWVLKNCCFWTVVLEKTLEVPLDCKEIQQVNPKGNQSWILIGRTDVEAETPILWPPDIKNWLFGKDPNAGKDWRWEVKVMTEAEMVGWHHWFNGHDFEQVQGVVMDREAWRAAVHGFAESWTWMSIWTELYGCESWTIKKAECRRMDIFELWCWKRLLRIPWSASQSILKKISSEYSLEGLTLMLKLQYFGHLM